MPTLLFFAKVSGAGLEVFLPAAFRNLGVRCRLLRFQIGEAGPAIAAADSFQLKLRVVGHIARQHSEQVAAELLARRAAQPMSPPDFAKRMNPRVAPAIDR